MRSAFVSLGAATALLAFGCDSRPPDPDAGVDAGRAMDAGEMRDDAQTPDAGTREDAQTPDAGPPDAGTDAGSTTPDAGSDAGVDGGRDAGAVPDGCVPDTCRAGECGVGVRMDGCGRALDCGACPVGGPCTSDTGCSSGTCLSEPDTAWPDGYCTRECRRDSDCAVGAHCAYLDDITRLGFCVADCTSAADCRGPDYACADADGAGVNECAPTGSGTGVVGDPCTAHSDCSGGITAFCAHEGFGFRSGYCSLACSATMPCPAGSRCGFVDMATGAGFCVLPCAVDGDCRADGYLCYNADGAAGNECYPAATGMGSPGDPCEGVWDCAGGLRGRCLEGDAFGGYCYTVGCVRDADCPVGSHCGNFGSTAMPVNICTRNCTSDTDCRAMGYACYAANDADTSTECWIAGTGTRAVGDPCEGTWECAGRDRALCVQRPANDFEGGYCLVTECVAGGTGRLACPAGSHCSTTMGAAPGSGFCVDTCTTDADCRASGYRCYDRNDTDLFLECWPAATGTGAPGAECRWISDCAGEENGFCLLFGDPATAGDEFIGGYCSQLCMGTTCPAGSHCTTFGDGMGGMINVCLDTCTMSPDCREPFYTCQMIGPAPNECWPAP